MMNGIKYQLFEKEKRIKQTVKEADVEASRRQTTVAPFGCRHDLETMVSTRGLNERKIELYLSLLKIMFPCLRGSVRGDTLSELSISIL